ncbi:MAG: divergent PAP2 family protein [Dehalococcoidia bacterium]|nr:divergent PAP2 family protein [Dehalococcoidia bacterium]
MESVLSNKVLLVPLAAWCVAQVLKILISSIRDKRLNFSQLITTGGMPSSHAALVCALATAAGIVYGLDSAVFGIAALFALVVMSDATGVRKTVGTQSAMLNRILDELFKGKPEFEQRVRELIGHTIFEVSAGAVLGILLAWWWT